MCGIRCIFSPEKDAFHQTSLETESRIGRRGPDAASVETVMVQPNLTAIFAGYVLHLRGTLTPQPQRSAKGDLLLWNGEVFGGIEMEEDSNDTKVLMELLSAAASDLEVVEILRRIQGPWAWIYWQAEHNQLWFGRDVFGRRSLLWHFPSNADDVFALSSVRIHPYEFSEVPSVGIYKVQFPSDETATMATSSVPITLFPWSEEVLWPGTANRVVSSSTVPPEILQPLSEPRLQLQVETSLGLDAWIPAMNEDLPRPDELLPELGTHSPDTYLQEVLAANGTLQAAAKQLISVLETAVQCRVFNLPRQTMGRTEAGRAPEDRGGQDSSGNCADSAADSALAKVAILFSGGIDSTVLAALADRCVPPGESIDLLNVAFELPPDRQQKKSQKHNHHHQETATLAGQFDVPDRLTGYAALQELNPDRSWNFVEVNVTLPELQHFRSKDVQHLLYPLCTVLDDSIGCALWFASRGQGMLGNGPHRGQAYTSSAKVLLCGLGADEQLGGYSRHRGRFQETGWQGLVEELKMEVQRLSLRNLGRDDRIIADHGKEARHPFLDENVVQFLSATPVHLKADLRLPRGLGEKLILRSAAWLLSLPHTATLPKRAIQFGSRIAKLENRREKASDVSSRLADHT